LFPEGNVLMTVGPDRNMLSFDNELLIYVNITKNGCYLHIQIKGFQ